MAERLPPWEILSPTLSAFAHDHITQTDVVGMNADALTAALAKQRPDILEAFKAEFGMTPFEYIRPSVRSIREIHSRNYAFRHGEQPQQAALESGLHEWRSDLDVAKNEFQDRGGAIVSFMQRFDDMPERVTRPLAFMADSLAEERRFRTSELARIRPKLVEVDVRSALERFASRPHSSRSGHPVDWRLTKVEDVGPVCMDPALLLDRAFANVITDSIEHSAEGATVEASLKSGRGRRADTYRLSAVNRGPKLTRDDLRKIGRERWTQHPEDPKRGHGKLAAALIAQAHGGRLEVRNARRNGRHYGPRLTLVAKKRPKAA